MKKIKQFNLLLLTVFFCLTLCSCGGYEKKIAELETIPMEERTEEDWENLVYYYDKAEKDKSELRHSYFSGDIQEEFYEGVTFPIYEILKLQAPTPSIEQGDFTEPVKLSFTAEEYTYGSLCIVVNWYEDGKDKSFTVYDQEILLPEPKTYYVYAYVIEKDSDDFCVSEKFNGTYSITCPDMPEISFTKESGKYKPPFSVGFNKGNAGKIYYTTDGSDPLMNGSVKGTLYEGGEISIPMGFTSVYARCVMDNGLVGPKITGEYSVVRSSAQKNSYVAENNNFEYVIQNGKVIQTNKATGETKDYSYHDAKAISVYSTSEKMSSRDEMGESKYQSLSPVMNGEVAVMLNEEFWRDYLWVNISGKNEQAYWKYTFVDGKQKEGKKYNDYFNGKTKKNLPTLKTNTGNEYTMNTLNSDDLAVFVYRVPSNQGGYNLQMKICNMDGSNEKIVLEEKMDSNEGLDTIIPDVIIGEYVFFNYYYGEVRNSGYKVLREKYTENFVYNASSGKIVTDPLSKEGWEVYGAISDAVYMRRKATNGEYEYKRISYKEIANVFGV